MIFSDEKIDREKIISERLNKSPNIENTNQKLFLDENNTFSYVNPICPVCGAHKIIKKGTITKNKQNINGKTTEFKEQQYQCKKCGKKFGIYNNPLIGKNKQFLQEIMDKIPGIMKIGYQSLRKISESKYLIKQSRIGPTKITKKQSTTKNLNIRAIISMMSNF